MKIALITEVYPDPTDFVRLETRLSQAASAGATVACLPEIPLNPWSPATPDARDEDAESVGGPRQEALSRAARRTGVAVIGGAIIRDAEDGGRHNTALVVGRDGEVLSRYEKLHLPDEPGFWETAHYLPGRFLPEVVRGFGLPVGVQICSDANRPEGTHLLAAAGAGIVFVPRATEAATYGRWRTVLRANAITSCVYVISVNRPGPEGGIEIGGPSVAIAADGGVMLETTDPLAVVEVDAGELARCRERYPGYLPVRSGLYAEGWDRVSRTRDPGGHDR